MKRINGFKARVSNKKQIFHFNAIIFSILLQTGSGIRGKYAALSVKNTSLFIIVTNTFYFLSLVLLVLQAIVWQLLALIYYPLSYAYSFLSLVNFMILVFSTILFQEQITIYNVLGLIFISFEFLYYLAVLKKVPNSFFHIMFSVSDYLYRKQKFHVQTIKLRTVQTLNSSKLAILSLNLLKSDKVSLILNPLTC
ncbi:hypothetical protein MSHOH_3110 [Methanosarcina horonobensis HB-1 = JCM 15518]|uniref:Transmembrane protein n=1 Tax=Methanosarcina horonobensis HB-1 = JCM 15518 TaxID=1434110 RepID=A0A0E3SI56_9EURY|nr:hypothetical protein MSHOH_3110 [Methanosarcina horonobensis HB-1 = JCM 15518]